MWRTLPAVRCALLLDGRPDGSCLFDRVGKLTVTLDGLRGNDVFLGEFFGGRVRVIVTLTSLSASAAIMQRLIKVSF